MTLDSVSYGSDRRRLTTKFILLVVFSAVSGCSHVIHVASPFPLESPADENELIRPAVQGTTFVLQACADAGTVKRVVLTSSVAAVAGILYLSC